MKPRERRAARLAYLAGFLILIGGGTGSAALYLSALSLIGRQVGWLQPVLLVLALVLPIIAALGGLAVMTGAFLYLDGRKNTGLLLIELGSGAGFVSVLLGLAGALASGIGVGPAIAGAFLGLSGLGVVLSLVARGMIVASRLKRS